jgi:hypothetical protein
LQAERRARGCAWKKQKMIDPNAAHMFQKLKGNQRKRGDVTRSTRDVPSAINVHAILMSLSEGVTQSLGAEFSTCILFYNPLEIDQVIWKAFQSTNQIEQMLSDMATEDTSVCLFDLWSTLYINT